MLPEKAVFVQGLDCEFAFYPGLFGAAYVKSLVEAGVTAVNETVASESDGLRVTVKKMSQFRRQCHEAGALVATTSSDIRTAKKERKLAAIMGLQALPFIWTQEDLGLIELLWKHGLRIAGLTYQRRNSLADGCGERTDSGLSSLGVKVVEEMNQVGMLLDLTHVGEKSSLEAMEISEEPAVFSHSNCRTLCDNARNVTDEQIKAIAEKDGVVCIASWSPLLSIERRPTIKNFLDHIDYVAKLAGINHVGIGFDFWKEPTEELWNVHESKVRSPFPELWAPIQWNYVFQNWETEGMEAIKMRQWRITIVAGLTEKGYSGQEIQKILGENLIRVFEKVWGK